MDITIKPHHLLDIFKSYGKGIEKFVPDEKYNHNFYFIGNAVIDNEIDNVEFTFGFDDICKPCNYLKENICIDEFYYNDNVYQKNNYNEKLDIRLIRLLNIEFNKTYEFKDMIKLLYNNLSLELINLVWYSCNQKENEIRYHFTREGINKFITKHS